MPELLEVELYRRLAEGALGRPVSRVSVPDPHCLRHTSPAEVGRALSGEPLNAARRRGKLLLLDGSRATLGVHFGMTGGLVVDDRLAIDRLRYGPGIFAARWVRFEVAFADGGHLALHDPRRLARAELAPDEEALGPDALGVALGDLRAALAVRAGTAGPPLKARLLDQSKLAGIGNLLADEILWRASLRPSRPCGSLTGPDLRRLHSHLAVTLRELGARGGSHTGDLMEQRRPGGACPRDGAALERSVVGGRTTWWCPRHQR